MEDLRPKFVCVCVFLLWSEIEASASKHIHSKCGNGFQTSWCVSWKWTSPNAATFKINKEGGMHMWLPPPAAHNCSQRVKLKNGKDYTRERLSETYATYAAWLWSASILNLFQLILLPYWAVLSSPANHLSQLNLHHFMLIKTFNFAPSNSLLIILKPCIR